MSPKHLVLAAAIGALAASPAALAIGETDPILDPAQCNQSSLFGEYNAPKRFASAEMEIKKGISAEELAARRADLHQWLTTSQPVMERLQPLRIELTRQDLIDMGVEPCHNCFKLQADPRRYQVGVAKGIGFDIDFGELDVGQAQKNGVASFRNGVVGTGPDGELVWTVEVTSPGATALRIGFEDFKLPPGAQMFVYNELGDAYGPYREWGPNDTGVFATNATVGDTAYLQLHYYGAQSRKALDNVQFTIEDIGHLGPRFEKIARTLRPEAFTEKAFCEWNESCIENVNCTSSSVVNDARSAVAEMVYRSGGGYYICTGGLLADTDTSSVVPYFLTANHCVSKSGEANSLETYFDFEVSCGVSGKDCPRYGETVPMQTLGATIVATDRTSDFTLLQLAATPGGTRAYLGWNNAEIAFTDGAGLHRISHPGGSPQAYSAHNVDTSKGTCRTWPRGNWIYSTDTVGATEGGSSGSPVLNSNGEVVGQLSGGCGTNVNVSCDSENNATVDGAFAAYFGQVQPFLDPSGGDGGGDGEDPPPACDLLPSGSQCTDDSQCCSGKCKGKPGERTCN
ncbi:MAG: serine protease [Xanthomonadales bacterium]|nr:serine protease [Xanthomonadales bacterium]